MTTRFKQRQILFVISIAIVAATFIAYEPIRHNGFVDLDDGAYITKNPKVNEGITGQSIIWAFTRFHSGNWHPLTWLSHSLDCEIYGLNPQGHHITNVLIHIVNSLLLLLVLRKMTGATWPSAFVAGVFALHPVHVESVAWAAERKDVLSGLFWMLTMLAYAWYVERPNSKRYLLVLLAYLMGIMAKPMVVTLPFVLLLLDWWPLGRFAGFQDKAHQMATIGRPKATVRHLVAEKIPLFVLSVISDAVTLIAQHNGGSFATFEQVSVSYRIANTFISYIRYIGKTLWPNQLAAFYPHHHYGNLAIAACILLVALITILSIYIGKHRRYMVTGWFWYVGTLIPVIGLVQVGSQAMADRYMYMPMVGLLIIIAWAGRDIVADNRRRRTAAAVSAVVLLFIAVMLTRIQVRYWQNNLTLFGHAVNVTENNHFAETNYGHALCIAGQTDEGLSHINKAVRISPNFSPGRDTLGLVLMEQGKINEAVACFNEVIRRDKKWKEGYMNLGAAMSKQGRYDEAIKYINKALELDAEYPDARSKIGTVHMLAGRLKEAIVCFNEGLQTSTNPMEVYVNLSIAYSRLGNYELSQRNRSKAMGLKTDNPEVLNNLAWLLATASDTTNQNTTKAIEFAQHACELTRYNNPEFLDTLAVAYAAASKFDEATRIAEKALNAARISERENLIVEIQKRIKLYEAGQPYREK